MPTFAPYDGGTVVLEGIPVTPPQYAKAFPSTSREDAIRATQSRVAARVGDTFAITPPQFAALLSAWRLEKLS